MVADDDGGRRATARADPWAQELVSCPSPGAGANIGGSSELTPKVGTGTP
jgi:hypothetical protein